MNTDPIEGEFFSTAHLDSITDALVRETIQNSLDAALPGRQVSVRFRLAREHGAAGKVVATYFSTLLPHLDAEGSGLISKPRSGEPFTFLVVEDYGTRGLEGDLLQDDDLARGAAKNDFFYFWRNVGRSGKGEEDRGRWGLGKTVFQACSRINSFVGLTVRASDMQALLMGQSVLKTHLIRGRKYYPYGWYGTFDGDFPLPVTDVPAIGQFCGDFDIDRQGKPGLSIVVPYPDITINRRRLITSVLVHYFFPIISGILSVEVDFEGHRHVIDGESIDAHISFINVERSRLKPENLESLFDLARWARRLGEHEYVPVKLSDPKRAPEWSPALFDESSLQDLRRRFEEGEKIALRVPLTIKPKHGHAGVGSFSLFLERDVSLEVAEDHFIREGITIAGVKSLRQRGVRVIVSADEKVITTMLGDAENPAHTEWQERSPKFQGRYERGASCLRFVKNSPREVVAILSAPSRTRDDVLLRDILYVDVPARAETAMMGSDGGEKRGLDSGDGEPHVTGHGRHLVISALKGGFRIAAEKAKGVPSRHFLLTTAYGIRRGDPFGKYSPFDFELDKPPIQLRGKNVKVRKLAGNQALVDITEDDFVLELTGFDAHRDLVVKTEIIIPEAS